MRGVSCVRAMLVLVRIILLLWVHLDQGGLRSFRKLVLVGIFAGRHPPSSHDARLLKHRTPNQETQKQSSKRTPGHKYRRLQSSDRLRYLPHEEVGVVLDGNGQLRPQSLDIRVLWQKKTAEAGRTAGKILPKDQLGPSTMTSQIHGPRHTCELVASSPTPFF